MSIVQLCAPAGARVRLCCVYIYARHTHTMLARDSTRRCTRSGESAESNATPQTPPTALQLCSLCVSCAAATAAAVDVDVVTIAMLWLLFTCTYFTVYNVHPMCARGYARCSAAAPPLDGNRVNARTRGTLMNAARMCARTPASRQPASHHRRRCCTRMLSGIVVKISRTGAHMPQIYARIQLY